MAKPKNKSTLTKTKKPDRLFSQIKLQIELARSQVAMQVNQSLPHLYWNINKIINHHILEGSRAAYSKEILATLSQQLNWSDFIELVTLEEE